MQKGGINIKSIMVGFAVFFVLMLFMPSLLLGVMPYQGMGSFVIFISSLIAGFITGVIAKKSEIANGIALGILLILFGAFSIFLVSTQARGYTYHFDFSHVFNGLITGVGAAAGGALRKYTKRRQPDAQTDTTH